MKIHILAVTKAFDKYCIAGINDNGEWIRPVPAHGNSRFWQEEDLYFDNFGFLRIGDILEINGEYPYEYQHPNHTEDYFVSHLSLTKRMSADELFDFLQNNEDSHESFNNTINALGRSLCLIKIDSFNSSVSSYDDVRKPKMNISKHEYDVTNPHTTRGDYIVKDCKWSNLILNNTVSVFQEYSDQYIVIGLATPYNGVEYPQIVGFLSNPIMAYPQTYPN